MRPQGVNDSDSPDPTTMRHRRKTMPYRRDAIASPWRLCRIAAFTLSFVLLQSTALVQAQGVLAPGDAVITGFSGSKATAAPANANADPLDALYIDLEGPSAKIVRIGVPGAPPQGQLIAAPSTLKVLAKEVGQVFPITLDDGAIPNIYLGQTAAFGLQIVGPGNNRLRKGQAGARWMPGQFGAAGGLGSIYKIDGRTGAVTLFASVPGNGGVGLGDIVFDKASRSLFVSDLDTGLIHRLDANGQLIGTFDHGIAGRLVRGLPPVADNGAQMDITSAQFDVEAPDTWGFTQTERQVWGMALNQGRLFYAVAEGQQVWSVGINPDGSFAGDPRMELAVAGAREGQVIADIAFDAEGKMYLAQRGAIRGSYDYSVFAEPEQSAVLRYQRDASGAWQPAEYAIGFPNDHRNANGGIALGYSYDASGMARRGACNSMLWSTGERLRNNAAHADKLVDEGPLDIHGLQGNDVTLVRPQNEPPFTSYFVDYDEQQAGSAEKAGHVGDVEIWQPCEGTPGFTQLVPGYPPLGTWPPGGELPPGEWVPPPIDTPTNLKLEKRAVSCWSIGQDKHRCGFIITVTNTGPGVYNDTIQVRDTIPAAPGVTAIFSSPTFGACPGGPPSYTCTSLAPVHLNPWEQVTIPVRVDVPDQHAKDLDCKVRNHAKILHAPSPSSQNTNPADDDDSATAHLPAHLCKKERTNLKITKQPLSCFKGQNPGQITCGYHARVWNMGPGVYNDKIEITDTVPPGTTAIFSGAGWNCAGGGPAYNCTRDPVMLNAPQSVLLVVRVNLSQARAKELGCQVRNRVKIDYAPSPSDQNSNPADDQASALAVIPPDVCNEHTNLALSKGGYGGAQSSDCALSGGDTWCKRYRIAVWNKGPGDFSGSIKVTDFPPANTKISFNAPGWTCNVATKTCQTNGNVVLQPFPPNNSDLLTFDVHLSGNDNDAKALNCKVDNYARIVDPVGAPKNTQAADDQGFWSENLPARLCEPPPVPLIDPVCPVSTRRVGNECLPFTPPPPPLCRDGQMWSNGHCCPAGLTWNGRRCGRVVEQCPPGTRGQPPHCYWVDPPKHCPPGTVGQWPSCRKIEPPKRCPTGMIGQWPNCKRPIPVKCPSGMVGTPPNCKRLVPTACPAGMVGKPPNCRSIRLQQGQKAFTPGRKIPMLTRSRR
jgi:hypothetical protein